VVLAISIIALMMELGSISETSVNLYQTAWRNNPEDSHLHIKTCCSENTASVIHFREHDLLK
jgi:hypothetical protein